MSPRLEWGRGGASNSIRLVLDGKEKSPTGERQRDSGFPWLELSVQSTSRARERERLTNTSSARRQTDGYVHIQCSETELGG